MTCADDMRSRFWSTSAAQALMIVAALFVFRETYGPTILESRAARLRQNTGSYYYTDASRFHSRQTSSFKVIQRSVSRPLRMLLFHPIIQINGLLSAFSYGVLYLVLTTFSDIWVTEYHETIAISGLHYLAIAFAEIAGSQVSGQLMDWSYSKLKHHFGQTGEEVPEYRIPIIFPFAFLAPLGMFLYGWAIHFHLRWPIVDLGVFILCFGMQVAGMQLQAYVIDTYADHVSSAMAATQFLSSLTAFAFPLFAPKLYRALGLGWGNSAIGLVALAIGVPAPLAIWVWGKKLREKARPTY